MRTRVRSNARRTHVFLDFLTNWVILLLDILISVVAVKGAQAAKQSICHNNISFYIIPSFASEFPFFTPRQAEP